MRERRQPRVADGGRVAFDGVRGAEDFVQQAAVVRRPLEVDQCLLDALQQLVHLGQEQRLVVSGQVELQLDGRHGGRCDHRRPSGVA